jgi:phage gpG-like protein
MAVDRNKWPQQMRGRLRIPQRYVFNATKMGQRVADAGRSLIRKMRTDQRLAFGKAGHSHHGGRGWRPLRPSTIKAKGHGLILIDSGHMRRRQSLRGSFRLQGRDVLWEVDAINNAPYAHFHQFGFVHFQSGELIEPRPPIAITNRDSRMVIEEIRKLIGRLPTKRTAARRRGGSR